MFKQFCILKEFISKFNKNYKKISTIGSQLHKIYKKALILLILKKRDLLKEIGFKKGINVKSKGIKIWKNCKNLKLIKIINQKEKNV